MSEPDTADEADATVTELAAEVDYDLQNRLWLKAITPVLQLRTAEQTEASLPDRRLQFALDRMYVAACERAARILRSDLSTLDVDGS